MRQTRAFLTIISILAAAAMAACGSSNDKTDTRGDGSTQAAGASVEDAPFVSTLKEAGYSAILSKRFPAQVPGRKGNVVVYRSASDRNKGGILYTNRYGDKADELVWHWYFDSAAPDSITSVELNDDGLWDVRIDFNNGKSLELIQDVDFTFIARPRDDFVAMNGEASTKELTWRVFDGDSTTVWTATSGGGRAYIDIPMPLGAADGILSIRLGKEDRPRTVQVKVDGKKVRDFELQPTTGAQRFEFGADAQPGSTIRLEFKASGKTVAVSEIGIR
jgi:hypothetical protein